jgi:hypothetical protein
VLLAALSAAALTVHKASLLTRTIDWSLLSEEERKEKKRFGISQPSLRLIALGKRSRLSFETHRSLERLAERISAREPGQTDAQEVLDAAEALANAQAELRQQRRLAKGALGQIQDWRLRRKRLERRVDLAQERLREADWQSLSRSEIFSSGTAAIETFRRELRFGVLLPERKGILLARARRKAAQKK